MGVLGGVPAEIGIVPPAAVIAAHASLPERDAVLRRVLTEDEIAAISYNRLLEGKRDSRRYTHHEQVQRDVKRNHMEAANKRRAKLVKSPAQRKKDGDVFKLGRTAPLDDVEMAEYNLEQEQNLPKLPKQKVDVKLAQEIEDSKPRNKNQHPKEPKGEPGGISLTTTSLGTNLRSGLPAGRVKKK